MCEWDSHVGPPITGETTVVCPKHAAAAGGAVEEVVPAWSPSVKAVNMKPLENPSPINGRCRGNDSDIKSHMHILHPSHVSTHASRGRAHVLP